MISLLPYQEAAHDSTLAAFDSGHRQVIVQMPTGTGKTVLYLFLSRLPRWKRVLVIAHRKELLDQPIKKLPEIWPDAEFGVVRGERDGHFAKNIVFASVQTASRPERLKKLLLRRYDLIIVDEAHRAAADTYQVILRAFPDAKVVGLTATPGRGDKKTLFEAGFTAFAYRMSIDDAIRYDHLAPFEVERVMIPELDVRGVKIDKKTGDFNERQLGKRAEKNRCVARAVPKIYKERCGDRRAVVFTPSPEVAEQCVEEGRAAGLRCEWLSDKDDDERRERIIAAFAAGKYDFLANYGILTEGWDDQRCDCAIIARLTRVKGTYIQMFGRVLRKHPQKKFALIVDCAPNFETHGIVYGGELKKKRTRKEKEDEAEGLPVLEEFENGEESPPEDGEAPAVGDETDPRVASLLSETGGGVLALGASRKTVTTRRVAWIECGEDLFAIPLRDEDHIVLKRHAEGGWVAHTSRETLIRHEDMALVQGVAEEHARKLGATRLTKEDALWRSAPANDGQLGLLDRLDVFYTEGLTQGEAADLITAAKVKQEYGVTRRPLRTISRKS